MDPGALQARDYRHVSTLTDLHYYCRRAHCVSFTNISMPMLAVRYRFRKLWGIQLSCQYQHFGQGCLSPCSRFRQHITESIFSMNAASQLAVIFRDAVEEVLHYIEFRQFRMYDSIPFDMLVWLCFICSFQNSSYIEDVYALLTERKRMNCHDGLCSRVCSVVIIFQLLTCVLPEPKQGIWKSSGTHTNFTAAQSVLIQKPHFWTISSRCPWQQ